ncbi:cytochrome b-c1 complex subunit 1, mitochondrial [Pyxicephalus adspersus]|uniref:cytochrome b-c1 complex subunit 1, mitochondrial n=1 Tax=Pyxicephalus adspersus TaxID=30357 RepID=UPI003B5BAA73
MAASVCRAGGAAARTLLKGPSPSVLGLKGSRSAVTYAQALSNIPETQISTLDNGLRVASEESGQPTCTVGVWIGAGSRYESPKNNGAGYFLEHLAFKGTKKRPQAALEQEVESIGAHLSTYTTREQTAIYIKALSKDLPKAVEILADVVQNNSLEDSQVEQARQVLLQELQEIENNLQEVTFDYLHATAYQGTPLSKSVLGPLENAKKLTRADLLEYVNRNFKAPRTVLAAAGGINHNELCELAQRHFSGLSTQYEKDAIPVLTPCRFTGSGLSARNDDLPLAHIAIAVEGPGLNSKDKVALALANTIISSYDVTYGGGKNLSSNVGRAAAEFKLCQSFQPFNIRYSDTGLLGMYFVTDKHRIEDMLHVAQAEWRVGRCHEYGLPVEINKPAWLTVDISRFKLTLAVFSLSRPAQNLLTPCSFPWQAVNAKTLRDVCTKYIYEKCPAVAAVGPVEQLPDYNRIRNAMYWLRV